MADDLTIILRASGEAPAPALRTPAGELFARLTMRLIELRRADAALFATSFADPAHATRLSMSERLWNQVTALLYDARAAVPSRESADAPLIAAMAIMDRWLQLDPDDEPADAGKYFAAETTRILPRGESVLAYQLRLLVNLALDTFRDICGIEAAGDAPQPNLTDDHGGPASGAAWAGLFPPVHLTHPGLHADLAI